MRILLINFHRFRLPTGILIGLEMTFYPSQLSALGQGPDIKILSDVTHRAEAPQLV